VSQSRNGLALSSPASWFAVLKGDDPARAFAVAFDRSTIAVSRSAQQTI
jgi:hypothetical protein